MNIILLILFISSYSVNLIAEQTPEIIDCSYKNIELHGKVQFVESFPDFKIKIVESFPDIRVQLVKAFPDNCGEWVVVNSFPDFKVEYVESFPGKP